MLNGILRAKPRPQDQNPQHNRPDLVGEDISSDLSDLRDQIPPFDSAIAKRTIEDEFGQSVDELFTSFDDEPIAAASIAQVHKAITKDGKKVNMAFMLPINFQLPK